VVIISLFFREYVMSKRKKKKTSKINLGIAAIALSGIAILISLGSLFQSGQALKITKEKYMEDRLAVWQGEFMKDPVGVKLSPIAEGINLQNATVYFPPQIDSEEYSIISPEYLLPLSHIELQVQNIFEEIASPDPDSIMVGSEKLLPLVIRSQYVAQGKLYQDTSLYFLQFMVFIGDDVNLIFNSLLFGQRIETNSDIEQFLKNEFELMLE
jgi:hypothetical protein